MSKMVNKVSLGLILTVGVGFLAIYQSDTTIEDVGENIALKLMEILPRKNSKILAQAAEEVHVPLPESGDAKEPENAAIPPSKASTFDPVGHYNAKKAMQRRYENLKDICKRYGDFLRVEYFMTQITPVKENFLHHAKSDVVFCPLKQVGYKSYKTLFDKIREMGEESSGKKKLFLTQYPRSARDMRRAILVRHPLERLISAYRYNFEKTLNAMTNEEEGGDVSFSDFIYMLLQGPIEYGDFLEENNISGGSVALDTGMLDGLGISNNWNPYWRQCGVCNSNLMPHYILHMDHYKEDAKVLVEMMGYPEGSKEWLMVDRENKSGWKEVEEYYYSQLTKSEIRELYEKYKPDHELFGFTPDYYIAMGKDDPVDGNGEDDESDQV